MKSIVNLLVLTILMVQFSSCKNNGTGKLTNPKFEKNTDSATIIFQDFENQTLLLSFDTALLSMTYEENKTTIISKSNSSPGENKVIIHKSGENYSIEQEHVTSQCDINSTELNYHKLGDLLIGSCWLETNGIPWSDSGSKAIFSTQYGVILSKGHQTGIGQVIYSVDGQIIPMKQRQELLAK